ncbi:hypothetical protein M3Y94_01017000 [Aphelenchoides besseyi]|nr:hypothetical protein M3Y94_01017000 [Aphelenchoides besseyi]KAI6220551.1 hypothetical protein M3Y95_01052300 [Aphelenchoides besseyi]
MLAFNGPKVSFNVKKQTCKVITAVDHSRVVEPPREAVKHFENRSAHGTIKKKEEVVIAPIQQTSGWRTTQLESSVAEDAATDNTDDRTAQSTADVEADDVEPDYNKVNVSEFGNAFLRGLG